MTEVENVIAALDLKPHPEGGYFAETYRSEESLPVGRLLGRYSGPRSVGTAIYYLLTEGTYSLLHRVKSDEIWHFYAGGPVELLLLEAGGKGRIRVLGPDIRAGMRPQVVVPRGVWQGARLKPGTSFALMGTTVSPGFDFADLEYGDGRALQEEFPEFKEMIREMAR